MSEADKQLAERLVCEFINGHRLKARKKVRTRSIIRMILSCYLGE